MAGRLGVVGAVFLFVGGCAGPKAGPTIVAADEVASPAPPPVAVATADMHARPQPAAERPRPEQPELPDPQDPVAASLFLDGQLVYGNGDYVEAARLLRFTYAIDRSPLLLYPWAQAERMSGNCPLALELYQRFLDANPHEGQASFAMVNSETCREQMRKAAADSPPSKPESDLLHAHEAWLDDDILAAYRFAKASFADANTDASVDVMAIAACSLKDETKARAAARALTGAARDAVTHLCANAGLEL